MRWWLLFVCCSLGTGVRNSWGTSWQKSQREGAKKHFLCVHWASVHSLSKQKQNFPHLSPHCPQAAWGKAIDHVVHKNGPAEPLSTEDKSKVLIFTRDRQRQGFFFFFFCWPTPWRNRALLYTSTFWSLWPICLLRMSGSRSDSGSSRPVRGKSTPDEMIGHNNRHFRSLLAVQWISRVKGKG